MHTAVMYRWCQLLMVPAIDNASFLIVPAATVYSASCPAPVRLTQRQQPGSRARQRRAGISSKKSLIYTKYLIFFVN
jgi:hypothetical protein